MLTLALLLQVAAMPPSPLGDRLGGELARQGMLSSLLPVLAAKETDEMVAAHPELDADGKAELRRTAAATLAGSRDRLMTAIGRQYAQRLTVAQMRELIAFNKRPAAARYRAIQPQVIAGTMASVGAMDFKGDTLKAFCAKTGKACPAK